MNKRSQHVRGAVYVKGYWRRKPVKKLSATHARAKRPRGSRRRRGASNAIIRFLTS